MLLLLLSGLFVCLHVETEAVFIRSGVLRDHARDLHDGVFDYGANRGVSSYITDDGFHSGDERKYIGGEDAGRYSQGLADDKRVLQEHDFAKNNFYRQGAGGLANTGRQSGHKAGHHNTGFTNSYHKDETGNKSNFYDISDDQGDRYLQNSQQGLYGDFTSSRDRDANYDGGNYHKDDSRYGLFNNQGLYDKNLGTRRNYNQERFNDDRSLHGQSNAGGRIGETGRYEEYRNPHHINFRYAHPGYYHNSHRSYIPVYENTYEDGLYSRYPSHGNFVPGHYQKGFHI